MSKTRPLVDFQIYARPTGLADGEQRPINEALFATYEPLRLWLKERSLEAPFRKLVVSLADERSAARWHGAVAIAAGVCEVTEAVDLELLRRNAGDHRWVLGIVAHALQAVAEQAEWTSEELTAFVASTSAAPFPLLHFFRRLARTDRASGVECVPWLSAQPGETRIGLRLLAPAGTARDVTILSKPGPLFWEDEFPAADSAIRDDAYLLLDKSGKELGRVPLPLPLPHPL